jgi:DNA-directed RNA polymerase specialized sigma24 family protein
MSLAPDDPAPPPDYWSEPWAAAELYERLRGGDPAASSDLAAAFLDPLVVDLRAYAPHADEHAVVTAAEDAVLSLIHNPAGYNPALGTLAGYARMAARRDLLNLVDRERRHHRGRESGDRVEDAPAGGNCSRDDAADLPSFDDPDLAAVIASFDEGERRVFELMRAGVRGTAEAAAALDLGRLPAAEQAAEVKRVKERIFKRFRRAGGRV